MKDKTALVHQGQTGTSHTTKYKTTTVNLLPDSQAAGEDKDAAVTVVGAGLETRIPFWQGDCETLEYPTTSIDKSLSRKKVEDNSSYATRHSSQDRNPTHGRSLSRGRPRVKNPLLSDSQAGAEVKDRAVASVAAHLETIPYFLGHSLGQMVLHNVGGQQPLSETSKIQQPSVYHTTTKPEQKSKIQPEPQPQPTARNESSSGKASLGQLKTLHNDGGHDNNATTKPEQKSETQP